MSDVVSFEKQLEKLEEKSTETKFEKSKSNCDNSFQQKINSKEKPELLEEAQFEKPCKQSNCLENYTEEPYDTTWKKSTESKIEKPLNSSYSENSTENRFEKPHDKENSIDSSNEDSEWEYYSDDDSPMLSSDKLKPFRVSKPKQYLNDPYCQHVPGYACKIRLCFISAKMDRKNDGHKKILWFKS